MGNYVEQMRSIAEHGRCYISSIKPSVWAEQNIKMPDPFPGPLRYSETEYTREIIDCFADDHPSREIAVMGAAQFGKTASIIIPVIGYLIENNPGNIIMTVGHESLINEAMARVDYMLDTTGLRSKIKSNAQRAKSNKTGDTNTMKEFPKGYLKISAASNYKIWQQSEYKFGLIDDYDRVKGKAKEAGNIRSLIEKRFTTNPLQKKILYVSSPDLAESSNILKVFLMGDQRKFLIPCPCCGVFIELIWNTDGHDGKKAGITWELDDTGSLNVESVGYICQECGGVFDDKDKPNWVKRGYWNPTAKPFKPEFYSFHMNCLYSPLWMDRWKHYVYKFLECHPPGGGRKESEYQAFLNLNLGLPYEPAGKVIEANALQKNTRNYEVGQLPEKLSIADGNGRIVMVTCAADINGRVDDARLDYEIIAWTESGSTYSISHGSVGTFIPNESGAKVKKDRQKMSYEHGLSNSVWPVFEKIISQVFRTDVLNEQGIGRGLKIFMTTIDVGYRDKEVWQFIDNSNCVIRGVKGDKEDKYIKYGIDVPTIKKGRERAKLYILQIGLIKDDISEYSSLKWDYRNGVDQPSGYMNFPQPSNGKYQLSNFFSHFSAEHRITIGVDGEIPSFRWVKLNSTVQNHMFDCRVYNYATRDIILFEIASELKVKSFVWADLVKQFGGNKK
jgi:phage terminase large subunit GpA-like protein